MSSINGSKTADFNSTPMHLRSKNKVVKLKQPNVWHFPHPSDKPPSHHAGSRKRVWEKACSVSKHYHLDVGLGLMACQILVPAVLWHREGLVVTSFRKFEDKLRWRLTGSTKSIWLVWSDETLISLSRPDACIYLRRLRHVYLALYSSGQEVFSGLLLILAAAASKATDFLDACTWQRTPQPSRLSIQISWARERASPGLALPPTYGASIIVTVSK